MKQKQFTVRLSQAADKWLTEEAFRRRLSKNAVILVLIEREMEKRAAV